MTVKGWVFTWGLAANGQLGVARGKGLINDLLQKNGIQFAPAPQPVAALAGKVVDRVIAKRNCTYAFTDKDRIYCWGHMPKGLNFRPHDEVIDVPVRNEILEGMNFRDIALSQDSATAIARSILLNFEIPDPEDSEDERPRMTLSSPINKKDAVTCVSVHAIPIFDGQHISSEADLSDNLIDFGEMNVELISDFDIPWVVRKTGAYPKYRRIRRRRRAVGEGEEGEEGEDYGSEEEDKEAGAGSDEEEEEEDSQRDEDESGKESEDAKSEEDEEAREADEKAK